MYYFILYLYLWYTILYYNFHYIVKYHVRFFTISPKSKTKSNPKQNLYKNAKLKLCIKYCCWKSIHEITIYFYFTEIAFCGDTISIRKRKLCSVVVVDNESPILTTRYVEIVRYCLPCIWFIHKTKYPIFLNSCVWYIEREPEQVTG